MSIIELIERREMWSPTHVQVLGKYLHILNLIFLFDKSFLLVKRAKGLNLKGKNGEGKMNWRMENYA